jgi:hypothetical protein
MAMVVPFIMSATGASAALGAAIGVSASMASTLTMVAFQVTGISSKINKAASKVFGEDLVMVANIFGAGYAMFNGGFDIGSSGDAAAAAGDAAAGTSDMFSGGGELYGPPDSLAGGGLGTGTFDPTGVTDPVSFSASAPDVGEAFNLSDIAKAGAPDVSAGYDLIKGGEPMVDNSTMQMESVDAPASSGESITPEGTGAAGKVATGEGATSGVSQNAARDIMGPPSNLAPDTRNIFQKMLFNKNGSLNEKVVAGALQGIGSAATGAMDAKERGRALKWQQQMYNSRPTGTVRQ